MVISARELAVLSALLPEDLKFTAMLTNSSTANFWPCSLFIGILLDTFNLSIILHTKDMKSPNVSQC